MREPCDNWLTECTLHECGVPFARGQAARRHENGVCRWRLGHNKMWQSMGPKVRAYNKLEPL
eukprot:617398-Amphidinium_carterae.1